MRLVVVSLCALGFACGGASGDEASADAGVVDAGGDASVEEVSRKVCAVERVLVENGTKVFGETRVYDALGRNTQLTQTDGWNYVFPDYDRAHPNPASDLDHVFHYAYDGDGKLVSFEMDTNEDGITDVRQVLERDPMTGYHTRTLLYRAADNFLSVTQEWVYTVDPATGISLTAVQTDYTGMAPRVVQTLTYTNDGVNHTAMTKDTDYPTATDDGCVEHSWTRTYDETTGLLSEIAFDGHDGDIDCAKPQVGIDGLVDVVITYSYDEYDRVNERLFYDVDAMGVRTLDRREIRTYCD